MLYSYVFVPTQSSNELILEQIIRGKVSLIRNIQDFMLYFIANELNTPDERIPFPTLRLLVEDAITMVQILQSPIPSKECQTDENYHPFHHFDQLRYGVWKRLGCSDTDIDSFWEDYKLGLCDALLGLWHPPWETSFLYDDTNTNETGSLQSILSCLDLTHRQSKSIPILDSSILDAGFITSNGPFHFQRTCFLHEHLTIKEKEILIFTDLEKLAGMRHHAVLQTHPDPDPEQQLCMFDILTSEDRYSPAHTVSIRPFITRLHYSVQSSLFLLFFQQPPSSHPHVHPTKSHHQAKHLGLDTSPDSLKSISSTLLAHHPTWDSFLDRTTEVRLQDPFMVPLEKLYLTLTGWKPRSFWEMRFPGYGNVDVVNLYGFYFGIMVGVAAMVGLVLTGVQTYTGIKGLSQAPRH